MTPEPLAGASAVKPLEALGAAAPDEELTVPARVGLGRLLWPKIVRSRRRSLGQRFTRLVFAVVGVLIALGIHAASVWFLRLCYGVEVIGPLLCQRLLDVVLLVLLSVLLLSNLVTALSSFFLARDLELLVQAPIPPRTFFSARFAEQLTQSSWMVLAFGLPVLFAFARVAGGAATYVALVAVLLPLMIIPAAAGAILSLMLVFSFPAARVRDLVVGMMFIAFIVLYVLARLIEPERFLNPDGFASMVSFLASFSTPSTPLLPSHWATSVVASTFRDATSTGAGASATLMLAALWTGAGSAHVLASSMYRRLYPAAFSRGQQGRNVARLARLWARLRGDPLPAEGQLRTPGRHAARGDWMRALGRLAPRGVQREFMIKDLKLLLRDASQWSQLVLLLALVFVYLYNFRYFRTISESGLVGPQAMVIIGMALSGFVTAAVSVRFAYPLISLEGRMLWLLGTAPVRPEQILRAKVMSTLPPLIVVAEVMAIASARILGADTAMIALGATVAGMTAVSVGAISTGLGAVLPDYRAESAAKVAASFGGLVCMSLSIIVAFVYVACASYPAWWLGRGFSPRLGVLAICAGVALLTLAVSIALPLWLGARSLARQGPV